MCYRWITIRHQRQDHQLPEPLQNFSKKITENKKKETSQEILERNKLDTNPNRAMQIPARRRKLENSKKGKANAATNERELDKDVLLRPDEMDK